MKREYVMQAIREAIVRVAPDADVDGVALDDDLRDELDIDSMDFLRLVTTVSNTFGIEIPEGDYEELETLEGWVDYVVGKAA